MIEAQQKGLFITLEGNEGSGKSVQLARIKQRLELLGYQVVAPKDPGTTKFGELLRPALKGQVDGIQLSPMAEFLGFCAARAQLVHEIILPALKEGKIVISDRFVDSTYVYQCFVGGIGKECFDAVHKEMNVGVTIDRTFFIDVPVELGIARTQHRKESDKFDSSVALRRKVDEGYRSCMGGIPRVSIINGTKSIEDITEQIVFELLGVASYKNKQLTKTK